MFFLPCRLAYVCILRVWCLSIRVYPFTHNSMLLLLKMKTEEKVIARTNGRQPGMKAEILHISWHNAVLWCTNYTHFVCIWIENYHLVALWSSMDWECGKSNAFDTISLCLRCRRCRGFFAHAINRYSFRVEESSLSSSWLTLWIHLYRNHMAFGTNNTHTHIRIERDIESHEKIVYARLYNVYSQLYHLYCHCHQVTICWWINMLQIMDHLMIEMLISVSRMHTHTHNHRAETFNFNFITPGHFYFIQGTFYKCLSHSIWLTDEHDTTSLYNILIMQLLVWLIIHSSLCQSSSRDF